MKEEYNIDKICEKVIVPTSSDLDELVKKN